VAAAVKAAAATAWEAAEQLLQQTLPNNDDVLIIHAEQTR
jgi:hypothetical protein